MDGYMSSPDSSKGQQLQTKSNNRRPSQETEANTWAFSSIRTNHANLRYANAAGAGLGALASDASRQTNSAFRGILNPA